MHRDIHFSVKDSLHFLSCSLSKAAKSFLEDTDRKTDFPHHEILTQDDLQREMQEWLKIDVVVSSNVEKERMLSP
jgi:glutaredoxin-related protein